MNLPAATGRVSKGKRDIIGLIVCEVCEKSDWVSRLKSILDAIAICSASKAECNIDE
jgi:hypothetical protein